MASIEERRNAAGKVTSYRVIWRDQGTKRTQTVRTRAQAEQWQAILEAAQHDTAKAEQALLVALSTAPTLAEVAEHHISRLTNAQPDTMHRYRRFVTGHLAGMAGLPVDKITEDDLVAWIRGMQQKGSSPKTIKNVHGFLHAVMATAVRRQLRPDNPCNGALLPRDTATEDKATFLTVPEFNRLMGHVDEHYHPVFGFLLSTGLRFSEMAALEPADVVLDARVPAVRVTKAWKHDRAAGRWYVGPPKTRKGRRTVSIGPSTVDLIRPAVEAATPGTPVFRMANGSVMRTHKVHEYVWQKAVKAANAGTSPLGKVPRIHDLRHSHAALMIAAGMSLYELAIRLGHESIQTTADVYGHLVPDAHFRAAAMVEQALSVES